LVAVRLSRVRKSWTNGENAPPSRGLADEVDKRSKFNQDKEKIMYRVQVSEGSYESWRLGTVATFVLLADAVEYVNKRCIEGDDLGRHIRIATSAPGEDPTGFPIWLGKIEVKPFNGPIKHTPSLDMLLAAEAS
jgi:hypothetical protein